ncbi:MAG: pectate lyase [Alistipes sp.]|nr:pectate lyase [Alistipes sp.]
MRIHAYIAALLWASFLFTYSCGGDDGVTDEQEDQTEESTPGQEEEPEPEPDPKPEPEPEPEPTGEFPDYGAVKAFPTAEGFGRNATGGRGGEIFHVTSLADSGTGTLRDAVSQSNRTIVFDVAGVIELKSVLVLKSNQTLLFQTAPGDGIEIYNNRVSASGATNLIVRYMRVRVGKQAPGENLDAGGLSNGSNIIFDHCSFAWAEDENFSINSDGKGTRPQKITLQNSIIGQGCMNHSCGGLIQTSDTEGVTIFGNLLIDNHTRNFKVKGLNQYINNIVYNWGSGGCYDMGGDSSGHSDTWIENNYFIKGPGYTWTNTKASEVSDEIKNNPDICIPNGTDYYEVLKKNNPSKPFKGGNSLFDTYCVGNYYDPDCDGTLNGIEITTNNWSTYCSGAPSFLAIPSSKHPEIATKVSSVEAYNRIVKGVGATLPRRDKVDAYMIDELTSLGKKGVILRNQRNTRQYTLGDSWKQIDTTDNRPTDSDKDGIPDSVEAQYSLDKHNPSDAANIAANGYSNIENYTFLLEKE